MTDAVNDRVSAHYAHGALWNNIAEALAAAGVVLDAATPEDLAPLDHLHGRGIEATRELLERLAPQPGSRLLDIGAGIGGPARYAAWAYECHVTAVDLTPDFCGVAERLTQAAGLGHRVRIEVADALALPYEDSSFDAAISQYVLMNVPDEAAFFREAARVLKAGAACAVSRLCLGPGGPPHYPAPWAMTAETSFMSTPDETRERMEQAGFEILSMRDMTAESLAHHQRMRERIERDGPPVLGPHVVIGEGARERLRNAARSVEEGRTVPIEIVGRLPG